MVFSLAVKFYRILLPGASAILDQTYEFPKVRSAGSSAKGGRRSGTVFPSSFLITVATPRAGLCLCNARRIIGYKRGWVTGTPMTV